jgi:hypothetical protein
MDLKNIIILSVLIYILYTTYSIYSKPNEKKESFNQQKPLIGKKSSSETFTQKEMRKYPNMLKANCRITDRLHKKLRRNNNYRCGKGAKGKTDRETINNKRLCRDDIHKEIVTALDAESNCIVSALFNDPKTTSKGVFRYESPSQDQDMLQRAESRDSRNSILRSELASMKFPSRTAMKSIPLSNYATPVVNTEINKFNMYEEGPEYINKFFMPTYESKKTSNFAEINDSKIQVQGKHGKYADINSYTDIGFTSDPAFLYRLSTYEKNKPRVESFEKATATSKTKKIESFEQQSQSQHNQYEQHNQYNNQFNQLENYNEYPNIESMIENNY